MHLPTKLTREGKRLTKNPQLMEELDKSIDDKVEKTKLTEGFLGYIISSTKVKIDNSSSSDTDQLCDCA